MSALWETVLGTADALRVARWLEEPNAALRVANLPRAAWPLVAGSMARKLAAAGRPALILCQHPDRFLDDLRPWLAGTPLAYLFAEVTVSFLDRPPAHDEAVDRRLEALAALAGGDPCLVVSSRRAASRVTLAPQAMAENMIVLRPGLSGDPLEYSARLLRLGYSREALVEGPAQFSLRGGILDVFPATGRSPVRAEWLGSEIETLRLFDAENQRSIMPVPQVTIRPGKELLIGADLGQRAAELLESQITLAGLREEVLADWEDDLRRLRAGIAFPGVELFGAYLNPDLPSLFDHVPENAVVIDLEPGRQLVEVREQEQENLDLAAAETSHGELPRNFRLPLVTAGRLQPRQPVLEVFAAEADGALELGWRELEPVVGRPQALAGLPAATTVLASEQVERVEALLTEVGVERTPESVDLDLDLEAGEGLFVADTDLAAGAALPAAGFAFYTDAELFGRLRRQRARPTRSGGRTVAGLSLEFQPGELVVHVDHGIARFVGMRLLDQEAGSFVGGAQGADTGSVNREYLELEYAEGDRLYVPVEYLDRVQKYVGGGDAAPPLHRLGTGDWERARSRARKSAQDVAGELLGIYSRREATAGIRFSEDSPWQSELEASFPYEETPDQLAAMADIKADMEAEKPMDRLLCGDVGFGKTELALRAAFKAVNSGRQVALLAPTTVLAQQHYLVFSQRLQPFPVRVDVLSRFRSEEQQADTLAALKSGEVDIVIGTHRLLQRDVRFKRLGLLIVDEEQRFGVMQKERLKRMRTQIDVLSLSATPIPRTLHMAVAGIRDMSVVQTPPEDRQPIKTYVTADEDELVREVIQRELDRGGQVYFVHNRVRTIQRACERVQTLLPKARLAVAHGQMQEDELARVMVDFAAGNFDVLVCTTIIESGLDIPNVNTLMVQRADTFGLSQLYQLRGRVGRAGKRAYAYFLYDPHRSLTEAADKRLDVISGLHELGMGFKIALRDLEIRGAGNLLGVEQHGAIASVGFEMYLQMLHSEVNRLRKTGATARSADGGAAAEPAEPELEGERALTTPEMNLDLPLDHFIPRSYIRDERLRLGAYRQLANAEDEEEMENILRSLRDRYGPLPAQIDNLGFSIRVKLRGQRLRIKSIIGQDGEIVITVDPNRVLDVSVLERRFPGLRVRPNRLRLRMDKGWQAELIRLLDVVAELYGTPVRGAAVGAPA